MGRDSFRKKMGRRWAKMIGKPRVKSRLVETTPKAVKREDDGLRKSVS